MAVLVWITAMPPTDRNNADERRARIESMLEELRAKNEPVSAQAGGRKRSKRLARPVKADISSTSRRLTKKT